VLLYASECELSSRFRFRYGIHRFAFSFIIVAAAAMDPHLAHQKKDRSEGGRRDLMANTARCMSRWAYQT